MDLELDLDLRTFGRAPRLLTCNLVRELEDADLAMLAAEKGSKAPALKRISERHHSLARAISSGMSMGEAALMCGYAISRISILKDDPAFKELCTFYKEEKDRAFRSVNDKLAGIASDMLDELQTRVEDEPEKFTVGQILQTIQMAADRTGNGPSSTQTVNVNDGLAMRLEAARKRVAERRLTLVPKDSE